MTHAIHLSHTSYLRKHVFLLVMQYERKHLTRTSYLPFIKIHRQVILSYFDVLTRKHSGTNDVYLCVHAPDAHLLYDVNY
jgi:hypothetical protein